MHIRGIKDSGDGSMNQYEGNTARTVTAVERTLTPRDGEVVVTVVQRYQRRQISIDPSFLVPWNTVVGSEVVATNGPFLGLTGVVVGSEGEGMFCTVRPTSTDGPGDIFFESKNLANLEPIEHK